MRRRLVHLGFAAMLGCAAQARPRYFPPHTFDQGPHAYPGKDKFFADWYSEQLDALQEPSLFEQLASTPSAASYRFLWLRSFNHPMAVRIDVQPDGTSIVTLKVASGAGGYEPGKLITNDTKHLTLAETKRVLDRIHDADFWKLPIDTNAMGLDGSQWVLEGSSGGRYHLSEAWTPENGPIHDLGTMFLFDLAKLQIPKDEMY